MMSQGNNNKYVPPNRRNQRRTKSKNVTKSKEVPALDTQSNREFPVLGSKKRENENEKSCNSVLSYAGVTREEEECQATTTVNDVEPGWVKLNFAVDNRNKIQKKYGHTNVDVKPNDEEQINWGLNKEQSKELNSMAKRWQSEHDLMNDYLDQQSPYWGMKHIDDPLSEDDLESDYESDVSSENSDEYYEDMNDDDYL